MISMFMTREEDLEKERVRQMISEQIAELKKIKQNLDNKNILDWKDSICGYGYWNEVNNSLQKEINELEFQLELENKDASETERALTFLKKLREHIRAMQEAINSIKETAKKCICGHSLEQHQKSFKDFDVYTTACKSCPCMLFKERIE